MSTAYWCEWAWLPERVMPNVLLAIDDLGHLTDISTVDQCPAEAEALHGVVLPGFANAHSHAFHRALRGRTHGVRGTFWTWREQMYRVADLLDPDAYRRLATAVYAEMALTGITCVGEFHYLHHPRGGGRYDDPNAMAVALAQAAHDAGIRLTLLDTCYLSGGMRQAVEGTQLRFADRDVADWLDRVHEFTVDDHRVRLGAAVHSVRAVEPDALPVVREWARHRDAPLHVHLSEQRAENEACLAAHGCTPTQLLESYGTLGPDTTAIHATHVSASDLGLLARSGTRVCLCPTTEADLADGIGPAALMSAHGIPLALGSDGQSVIDPFAEMRAIESNTRLATETRGHFTASALLQMATAAGYDALGWKDIGRIEVGMKADLVAVDVDNVRLAGVPPEAVPFVADAAAVRDVIVDGRYVVRGGVHQTVPDVSTRLATELAALQ